MPRIRTARKELFEEIHTARRELFARMHTNWKELFEGIHRTRMDLITTRSDLDKKINTTRSDLCADDRSLLDQIRSLRAENRNLERAIKEVSDQVGGYRERLAAVEKRMRSVRA